METLSNHIWRNETSVTTSSPLACKIFAGSRDTNVYCIGGNGLLSLKIGRSSVILHEWVTWPKSVRCDSLPASETVGRFAKMAIVPRQYTVTETCHCVRCAGIRSVCAYGKVAYAYTHELTGVVLCECARTSCAYASYLNVNNRSSKEQRHWYSKWQENSLPLPRSDIYRHLQTSLVRAEASFTDNYPILISTKHSWNRLWL